MAKIDLSILITCYNKEEFLDECIHSIFEQTVKPKEVVLVHDGCENPMAHAKAVTLIYPDNKGVVRARAEAFRYSTGQLILYLDGDDKLPPTFIEEMLAKIRVADVVYPDILWWYPKYGENTLTKLPRKIAPKTLLKKNQILVSSLMKRKVYEEVGGFSNWLLFEDWDFWLKAMAKGFTFAKANTFLWYRQMQNTRNRGSQEERSRTFDRIRGQFYIKDNKLCLKD